MKRFCAEKRAWQQNEQSEIRAFTFGAYGIVSSNLKMHVTRANGCGLGHNESTNLNHAMRHAWPRSGSWHPDSVLYQLQERFGVIENIKLCALMNLQHGNLA